MIPGLSLFSGRVDERVVGVIGGSDGGEARRGGCGNEQGGWLAGWLVWLVELWGRLTGITLWSGLVWSGLV